jgi:hypothetical protein
MRQLSVGVGRKGVVREGSPHCAHPRSLTDLLSSPGSAVVTLGPYPTIIKEQVSPFHQPFALKVP